jgi:hypothetical protein
MGFEESDVLGALEQTKNDFGGSLDLLARKAADDEKRLAAEKKADEAIRKKSDPKPSAADAFAATRMQMIGSMMAMGFPREKVIAALVKANNDVEKAQDLLLSGEV